MLLSQFFCAALYYTIFLLQTYKNSATTNLQGIVEQLMFKLLDSQDLLKHLIKLLLAEDELGHSAEGHASLRPPLVLFSFVDGIVFGDPGAEDSLFAQAVDLGQATHTTLDVLLEDLAEVTGRTASALDHAGHSLALQKALSEETDRVNPSVHYDEHWKVFHIKNY